ncbi:hypothetical protein RJ640_016990 [Escallonia rubra]|uniref:Myb/SANT-like domain-containing protein n=1 Tax=Escallonia rubra TaxID=112253 RepID=A0AA88RYI2_9ASTE|nr:hypothetical protein RJ640_016990 [Escallonia rubra]
MASDLGSQIKSEPGIERHDEALHPQVSEQFQSSEMLKNSSEDNYIGTQLLSFPSGSQNFCSSLTQTTQQMQQLLHQHQFVADSENDFTCPIGVQSEAVLQGQWHSRSDDGSHMARNLSHEQNVREEFHHRITAQDEAQRNNLSSEANGSCKSYDNGDDGSRLTSKMSPSVLTKCEAQNQIELAWHLNVKAVKPSMKDRPGLMEIHDGPSNQVTKIKSGNKPGTQLNRDGWANLVGEFNAMTGREYDKLQMKNHWDTLRRDWQNWDNLMHGESGLGWDPVRKTVDATDDWWERKIANNPNFAKFRYKNLEIN